MKISKVLAFFIAWFAFSVPAFSQAVQQSGAITPNSVPRWVSNGVIGGSVTANDSPITTFGVTSDSSAGLCVSSGRATAAGRQQLCLGSPLSSNAVISIQNYGTATAKNLCFNVNGTQTCIPTGGGGTLPTITLPLVDSDFICADGTTGNLRDCTWKQTVGSANQIPYWTSATTMGNVSAGASSILITSAGSVPSLSQTLPATVQTNITSLGTVTTGVWSATTVGVSKGGTGATTLGAHGALIGEGTSAVTSVTTAQIGFCLLSQGASSDPIWASCASGSGTAGGSDTQVQFNNSSSLAGDPNMTWISPALTLGVNATTTGQLKLASGAGSGASITIQNRAATSAYNFNLPTSAGTLGQPLISGGGGIIDMTFGTLQIVGGGTACATASATCLDNITGFSSTGYLNRLGAGSYTFSTLIPLSAGGTNAAITASNGGILYSTASAVAVLSGTATAGQILISGASSAPAWSTNTFPTTCAVSSVLYASSANVIACLATANNGTLITSAGGVPSISSTLPSAVQANITTTGTVTTGVWQGTLIALAFGGTNANLTASNGGIFYSTATAGAILAGTATASKPMLSGATAAPTWAAISYPTSATSGGVPYFSSTTVISSSAALGANQIVIGGGAGAAPSTFACATATTVVHGGTPPTCSQIVAADITTNTVTNANLVQSAAVTLKGNPTNATANASDFTINGLTNRGAPDGANDRMLIWDAAAGTLKYVTPNAIASVSASGVSSIAGNTGAFTLSNGITNSTNDLQVDSTVGRKSGSFTSGNLLVSNNTTGTYIDSGVAPITSVSGGTVYSNNLGSSTAPSFNSSLRISGGATFGDIVTYKKVNISGTAAQIMGIISSSSNVETSVYFVDASTAEWRVGANISNNNRFDVRDNTHGTGVFLIANDTGGWTSYSDSRLKTNIAPLQVLPRLKDFRAVSFDWKKDSKHDIGVIAQELEKSFPELVVKGSDGEIDSELRGAWGIQYARMGFLALQAVKELQEEVRQLKARKR